MQRFRDKVVSGLCGRQPGEESKSLSRFAFPSCLPISSQLDESIARMDKWQDVPYGFQVLLGMDGSGKAMHFDALRREVQLASRFNSERLVQVCHCAIHSGIRRLVSLLDGTHLGKVFFAGSSTIGSLLSAGIWCQLEGPGQRMPGNGAGAGRQPPSAHL